MPIYEYKCLSCGREFEELVRIGDTPPCPACGKQELERLRSMCAISTSQTRRSALESGRRIAGSARREKQHADAEYVRKHTEDHH
jgi:putative FmdB family regulatory protein